jgi:hypothetical protein
LKKLLIYTLGYDKFKVFMGLAFTIDLVLFKNIDILKEKKNPKGEFL